MMIRLAAAEERKAQAAANALKRKQPSGGFGVASLDGIAESFGAEGKQGGDEEASNTNSVARSTQPTVQRKRTAPLEEIFKLCEKMIDRLIARHKLSYIFIQPVDPIQDGCPNYLEVVKNPMDFATIRGKLNNKEYPSKAEFAQDMRLVFDNCHLFNGHDSLFGNVATVLSNSFEDWYTKLPDLKVFEPPPPPQPKKKPLPPALKDGGDLSGSGGAPQTPKGGAGAGKSASSAGKAASSAGKASGPGAGPAGALGKTPKSAGGAGGGKAAKAGGGLGGSMMQHQHHLLPQHHQHGGGVGVGGGPGGFDSEFASMYGGMGMGQALPPHLHGGGMGGKMNPSPAMGTADGPAKKKKKEIEMEQQLRMVTESYNAMKQEMETFKQTGGLNRFGAMPSPAMPGMQSPYMVWNELTDILFFIYLFFLFQRFRWTCVYFIFI